MPVGRSVRWTKRWKAAVLASVLVLGIAACGGAYGEAVGRGDRFAEAGLWDKAALEYEAAIKLDPDDPEAVIKLKEIRTLHILAGKDKREIAKDFIW